MRINIRTLVEVLAIIALLHLALVAWVYLQYLPGNELAVADLNGLDASRLSREKLRAFAVELLAGHAGLMAKVAVVYASVFVLLAALAWAALRNAGKAVPPPGN